MAFRKDRHPDMNLNETDYSITYQICQNFDIDRTWEQLAGAIGYSTSQIQTFELETRRPDGSPTKKLLWDWGTRGATVKDLYDKLHLLNKTQCLRLLEPIMKIGEQKRKEKHTLSLDREDNSSIMSKDDNLSVSSSPSMPVSGKLPIPMKMKKNSGQTSYSNVDVNLNTSDTKPAKPSVKDKQKLLGITGVGSSSVMMQVIHTDGPASGPGNLGAAASSGRSIERVKSVVEEYNSSSNLELSQLSYSEQEMARALIAIPHYTYKELSQATDGFSAHHLIGQGKYGMVYRGKVKNTDYAIKKLFQRPNSSLNSDTAGHLASELKSLSRYRHENIVSLYAYALDGDEICLVYQYMHNGSLEDCLHKGGGKHVLTWEQRLIVLRGAACGLQFLHSVDPKPVIHGDIKSSNILLDRHLEAKIGDLGMAQQATGGDVTGKYTHITKKNTGIQDHKNRAYFAPEMNRGSGSSLKGDTFAFGVVIFECLTGQQAFDSRREGSADEKNLVVYLENCLEENPKCNRQKTFQDQKLDSGYPQTVFTELFNIAERCTKEKKKDRPSMIDVYHILETAEESQTGINNCNFKGLKIDIGAPKVQDLSLKKQTSNDENMPNGNDLKQIKAVQSMSPVDILPPDQYPESVKLQLMADRRKEIAKNCNYVNVSKFKEVEDIFKSDTKKLAEIQKCEKDFQPGSMTKANKIISKSPQTGTQSHLPEITKEVLYVNTSQMKGSSNQMKVMDQKEEKSKCAERDTDKAVTKEADCQVVYVNTSEMATLHSKQEKLKEFKHQTEKTDAKQNESHDYINVKVAIDRNDDQKSVEAEVIAIHDSQEPLHDFDTELDEIREKADKPNSSMMDIFMKYDNAKDEEFDDDEFACQYADGMGFQFVFDQHASEWSTLKQSQSDNERTESFDLSAVTDEDLFGGNQSEMPAEAVEQAENQGSSTPQVHVGMRNPGENEEASSLEIENGDEPSHVHESIDTSLQRHRMKHAQHLGVLHGKREGDIMVDDLIAQQEHNMHPKEDLNRQVIGINGEVKGPPGVYMGLKVSAVDPVQRNRVPIESEYTLV